MNSNYISQSVTDLAERVKELKEPIRLVEWELLRLNSYEREFLLPFVSTEVLVSITNNTLKNCTGLYRPVATTYNEFATHRLVPELLKRLLAKENVNDN